MSFEKKSAGPILAASLLAAVAFPQSGTVAAESTVPVGPDARQEAVPASSSAPGDGQAVAKNTTPVKNLEQIRAAMDEADKRRREALTPDPGIPNEALAEEWGVEVFGISPTAGGYMLDFRFRVLDAEKALRLFDHRIKPYVKAEKSGIKLPVPVGAKVGAFRPTNRGKNIKSDKIYYVIFANPDSHLKTGDKVSVVIGDFRVEHLALN